MDSVQKYMLIGPLLLLVVLGVAYFVKKEASKPRTPEAQLYYARTIERRLKDDADATERDWLACIAQYERVFKRWPESDEVVDAYAHIGTIYRKQLDDAEQAKAWYDRVLREFPDSETADGVRRARTTLVTGEVDSDAARREAVAAYTDLIEHNPDSTKLDEILLKRGILYMELAQAKDALADFERIMTEFPNGTRVDDAVFYTGEVYRIVLEDEDKALEQYGKLIADHPKSNQIRVAHKRTETIWERRVERRLDGFFRERYGVERASMYFVPPTPLYMVESQEDVEPAKAFDKQMLDMKSAGLTVNIDGTRLVVTGSLLIANPSEVEKDKEEDEDESAAAEEEETGPTEATSVWLMLNPGMEIRSLTQGEATLEFKRHKNLVEVTLAEPIPVDGETTLAFEVANADGKDTPGIVIGEQYGHAFPHAFWFPVTKLSDAFGSVVDIEQKAETAVSNGRRVPWRKVGRLSCSCHEPVAGRFLVCGPPMIHKAPWGDREIWLLAKATDDAAAATAFLDEAVRAGDFLLRQFGTYPYEKIVFAQSPHVRDTVFEHGAGLILINDQVPLASIKPEHICNELAQQWYGCLVTPAHDQWLCFTAGPASYYETRYIGERYGEAAMEAHLATLRELYAEMFANIGQRAMVYRPEEQSETVFDALVYIKGAYFMRTLHWMAGDDAFIEAQRAFFEKNAFDQVVFKDLRVRFDKATGREFLDVFSPWLFSAGTPALKVEDWTTAWSGDQVDVAFTLTQAEPKYVLDVEIAFEAGEPGQPGAHRVVEVARITRTTIDTNGADENEEKPANGRQREPQVIWHESFSFLVPFNPERIVLDPNHRILLDPKSRRVWQRPASADTPAEELILELE